MSIAEEIKDSFRHSSTVGRLIYINIAAYFVIQVIHVCFWLSDDKNIIPNLTTYWLTLPASFDQFLQHYFFL